MTIAGNFTQTSAGSLNIAIGGMTAGTQYDQLVVTGSAALDGTLNVSLINGFAPVAGNEFGFLTFNSLSGVFATENLPSLGGGLQFSLVTESNDLTLSTISVGQASTTTALTSSQNPSAFGQSVTFTATVSVNSPGAGTPTGTVMFEDGGVALPSGTVKLTTVGGQQEATYTTSALSVATHSITAVYSGDTNDLGSTGTLTQTVNQAPAITSGNSTTFTVGTAGSFTVMTTGFPTPTVSESRALPGGLTFTDNGNGTATLSGTPTAGTGGTYPLTFTAHNGVGSDATQNFTLTVNQSVTINSTNLITNGSFENAVVDPGSSFITLDAGSTAILGWTVGGGELITSVLTGRLPTAIAALT